jgi:hypothetical protein
MIYIDDLHLRIYNSNTYWQIFNFKFRKIVRKIFFVFLKKILFRRAILSITIQFFCLFSLGIEHFVIYLKF